MYEQPLPPVALDQTLAEPSQSPAPQVQVEPQHRYLVPSQALVGGNRCALLRDGVEAYPAMLDAIRSAQHSIRLETYMFIDDAVGRLFARALAEAAERGVRVRV